MKIVQERQDIVTQLSDTATSFQVGQVAFLVDMLASDVYTYKEQAIIRELSCNAWDSQKRQEKLTGVKPPKFKVHLPTSFEPFFSIRDYGIGLSEEGIRTVYCGIGISDKRDTNDEIGCFGIGSLSPYCMTDSFVVISYYNGTRTEYTCYRDELREPKVAILTQSETDQPNGLEVIVNVDGHVDEFRNAAVNVFNYFDEVPEINIPSVKRDIDDWRNDLDIVTDEFCLKNSYGKLKAVMGNVAYDIPYGIDTSMSSVEGYVKFELGELRFDPGREKLTLDSAGITKAALEEKLTGLRDRITEHALEIIEEQDTLYKKCVAFNRFNKSGPFSKCIKNVSYHLPYGSFTQFELRSDRVKKFEHDSLIPTDNTVIFRASNGYQTRVREYVRETGKVAIWIKDEQIAKMQIDSDVVQDPSTLPKPTRNSSGGGTYTNKVRVYEYKGTDRYHAKDNWVEAEVDETPDEEQVYVEISRWKPVHEYDCYRLQNTVNKASSVIDMPPVYGVKTALTNTKKFQNSSWISLGDYCERELKKVVPELVYEYNRKYDDALDILVKIEHEDAVELKSLISENEDKTVQFWKSFGFTVAKSNELDTMEEEIINRYPMLKLCDSYEMRRNLDLIKEYVNECDSKRASQDDEEE